MRSKRRKSRKENWLNKRGVSPLIATVLLLGFAIVIAALVINSTGETTERVIGSTQKMIDSSEFKNIQLKQAKVEYYGVMNLLIESETGDYIDDFIVRINGNNQSEASRADSGLNALETQWFNVSYNPEDIEIIESVEVIPITEKGKDTLFHQFSRETIKVVDVKEGLTCESGDWDNDTLNDCVDTDDDGDNCEDSIDSNPRNKCPRNFCSVTLEESCNDICMPVSCLGTSDSCGCDSGECVKCSGDCVNFTCVPQCELLEAYWSNESVVAGQTVELFVRGRNCDGRELSLSYKEEDTWTFDDKVDASKFGLPTTMKFVGDIATTSWKIKEMMIDEDGNNPSYDLRFIASYNPSIESEILEIKSGGMDTKGGDEQQMGERWFTKFPAHHLTIPWDREYVNNSDIVLGCAADEGYISNVTFYTNLTGIWESNGTYWGQVHPESDANVSFILHFDDETPITEDGESPISVVGDVEYVSGKLGEYGVNISADGPSGIGSIKYNEVDNIRKSDGTVVMWIKPSWGTGDVLPNNKALWNMYSGGSNQVVIYFRQSDKRFAVYDAGSCAGHYMVSNLLTPIKNEWVHVALTWNSTGKYLYLNGQLDQKVGQSLCSAINDFYVGNRYDGTQSVDSVIDEFMIYNRTLTPIEVEQDYNRLDLDNGREVAEHVIGYLDDGNYLWNCLANNFSDWSFAVKNRTFKTGGLPLVDLEFPGDEEKVDVGDVELGCRVRDDIALSEVSLYGDWSGSWQAEDSVSMVGEFVNDADTLFLAHYNGDSDLVDGTPPLVETGTTFVNGKFNEGVFMEGTDTLRYDNSAGGMFNGVEGTIELWVKPNVEYNSYAINRNFITIGNDVGNQLVIYYRNSNDKFSVYDGGEILDAPVISETQGKWFHLAFTWDEGLATDKKEFYINGELKDSSNNDLGVGGNLDIRVGRGIDAGSPRAEATIDEIRIYNTKLSGEEVAEHANREIQTIKSLYLQSVQNLPAGDWQWNCLGIDEENNNVFADNNFALSVSDQGPSILLSEPEDKSTIFGDNKVNFMCNVTDDVEIDNISLFGNMSGLSGDWYENETVELYKAELEDNMIFYAQFDGSTNTLDSQVPIYEDSGIKYQEGKSKQGVIVDGYQLVYDQPSGFDVNKGTIEFWIKPDWYGNDHSLYNIFTARNMYEGTDPTGFSLVKWYGSHVDRSYLAFTADGTGPGWSWESNEITLVEDGLLNDTLVEEWKPGEWHHFVGIWYFNSWLDSFIEFYVDGELGGYFNSTNCVSPGCLFPPSQFPKAIDNITFWNNSNAVIDEFIIYDRILSMSEIVDRYNRSFKERSKNQTFSVSNLDEGEDSWNCMALDSLGNEVWAPQNWTYTFKEGTPIYECGEIDKPGNYILANHILDSSETRCIDIKADDITLDCQGYMIHGLHHDFTTAIYAQGQESDLIENIIIKNCNLSKWNKAIEMMNVGNLTFIDNNISDMDQGILGAGMTLSKIYNSTIWNNSIVIDGSSQGVVLDNSLFNKFENNRITTVGAGSAGFKLTSSKENVFTNNRVNSGDYGIRFFGEDYNNTFMEEYVSGGFIGISSETTGTNDNNLFIDSVITNNYGTDVELSGRTNMTFLNVTFDKDEVSVYDQSKLDVQWYLDVYAVEGINPVPDANVSAWDNVGEFVFSEMTNSIGYITRQNITEYFENETGQYFKTNYSIYAHKGDAAESFDQVNLTENTLVVLDLWATILPDVQRVEIAQYDDFYRNCDPLEGGCSIEPYAGSNATNITVRVTVLDESGWCETGMQEAYVHLCLVPYQGVADECNSGISDYSWQLNKLDARSYYDEGKARYVAECNFTFKEELTESNETPEFFRLPGNYAMHIDVTELGSQLVTDAERDTQWIYRDLQAVNYTDLIELGDGITNLGEWNPGTTPYDLINFGNVEAYTSFNASNLICPIPGICSDPARNIWNIITDPNLLLDDDTIVGEAVEIGLDPLTLTYDLQTFIDEDGLQVCTNYECDNGIGERMSTYWHIKPPTGLEPGTYQTNITYRIEGPPELDLVWTDTIDPSINSDVGRGITTDSSGNIYVTGNCFGCQGSRGYGIYTTKLNSDGDPQWAAPCVVDPSTGSDFGYGVVTDSVGNTYVTGQCDSDCEGTGTEGLAIYTVKIDSDGNPDLTHIRDPSTGADLGRGITNDSSGNIYVTGTCRSCVGTSSASIYTMQLDSNLQDGWTHTENPSNSYDGGMGITTDNSDNVYVTGYCYGCGSESQYAIFTMKLDSLGSWEWNYIDDPTSRYDRGQAITTDSSGNIYVTGYCDGCQGSRNYGVYTTKLDSNKVLQWTHVSDPSDYADYGRAIAVDEDGNVYVTGQCGNCDGTTGTSVYTMKLNSEGELIGEDITDPSDGDDHGYGITVDSDGNVYVIGDCDNNCGGTGGSAIYIMKFKSN